MERQRDSVFAPCRILRRERNAGDDSEIPKDFDRFANQDSVGSGIVQLHIIPNRSNGYEFCATSYLESKSIS